MAAKGYCSTADVANFLALTFTPAQTAQCEALIERTEIEIDSETNRAWLTGAITGEAIYAPPYDLWLRYAPVASVTAVTGRCGVGEDEEALVADEDYEVRDLNAGQIHLLTPGSYDRVLVDYTPVDAVPADLVQAIVEVVAARMQAHLRPGSYGLDSYSLPDLTVRYARSHVQEAMPPAARMVIDRYRYPVAV
ncbi:MAG: hypothetical protein HC804_00140 [Anaerolineae bacterium]|nr:hypothetical protein [Anaerolineae bacterium]